MLQRMFTRAQVVARFHEICPERYPGTNSTITGIKLLTDIDPPTWEISYTSVFCGTDGAVLMQIPDDKILLVQRFVFKRWELRIVDGRELPQGCLTVADEDREMEERGNV